MSNVDEHEYESIEWSQPTRKFTAADLRRNWSRWLFWAAFVTMGYRLGFAALAAGDRRQVDPIPLAAYPALFAGVLVFQLITSLCLWTVEIDQKRIKLGRGKGARYYEFSKVAMVRFITADTSPSMLLCFKSGRQVEVFLDPKSVPVSKVRNYVESAGVLVTD